MKVRHGLPAILPYVGDHAVAGLAHSDLFGNTGGSNEELSGDLGIARIQSVHGPDMAFRNDENVSRRLRVQIREGNQFIGLMHDMGGEFPSGDPAEDTVPWLVGHDDAPPLEGVRVTGRTGMRARPGH